LEVAEMARDLITLQKQVDVCREFVSGELTATEFIDAFLDLHYADRGQLVRGHYDLQNWLGDVWMDIDLHNANNDRRRPEELDDKQLLAAVTDRLRQWDDGTYPPAHT
jgi:hypothetical protein